MCEPLIGDLRLGITKMTTGSINRHGYRFNWIFSDSVTGSNYLIGLLTVRMKLLCAENEGMATKAMKNNYSGRGRNRENMKCNNTHVQKDKSILQL